MIVEIDKKNKHNEVILRNLEQAINSAKEWLEVQKDILSNKTDTETIDLYEKALNKVNNVKSIEELNRICQSLINYQYIVWYEMVRRPISIGCQPKGFVDTDNSQGNHGLVAYNRCLSKKELKEYEMRLWEHK